MTPHEDPDQSRHPMPSLAAFVILAAAAVWMAAAALYQTAQGLAWLWARITQP